jgi:APA family basic amino acid/polyamine antiporter
MDERMEASGLHRGLGLGGAVALGIGGTVGGGVYVLVGTAAGEAGPASLVAFALAFCASLLIALPWAELACRYPLAGGGYAAVRVVLGPTWGFVVGWAYWGAYVFISGYVTLGFGGYLEALAGIPRLGGALGLIGLCLLVNLLGVRVTGRVQVAIVAVALGGLLAFSLWGLPRVQAAHFEPFAPGGLRGVLLASLLAFLAFGGFDMVAAAGEEVDRPERNLPRAILFTLFSVLGLYLLVCVVAVGSVGAHALGRSAAPLADSAERFGGEQARGLVVVTALLTTAATANAVLVVTSRIAFAMARDGLVPAALSRVDERSGAPRFSVVVNAALLGAVALAGSVAFAARTGGFLYVLHFAVPLAALVVVRGRGGAAPAFETPAPRVVLPLAFAGCAALLVASGPAAAGAGAAWVALGAAGRTLAP